MKIHRRRRRSKNRFISIYGAHCGKEIESREGIGEMIREDTAVHLAVNNENNLVGDVSIVNDPDTDREAQMQNTRSIFRDRFQPNEAIQSSIPSHDITTCAQQNTNIPSQVACVTECTAEQEENEIYWSDSEESEINEPPRDCEVSNRQESSETGAPHNEDSSLANWVNIHAVILCSGSAKLTRRQYNLVREIMNKLCEQLLQSYYGEKYSKEHRICLPSYSMVQRKLRTQVIENLGAKCYDVKYDKMCNTVSRITDKCEKLSDKQTRIRIVPISEYARMDVAFPPFLQASKLNSSSMSQPNSDDRLSYLGTTPLSTPGIKHVDCVDDWPLVSNRKAFYGDINYIQAIRSLESVTPWKFLHRAYCGEHISLTLRGRTSLHLLVLQNFHDVARSSGSSIVSSSVPLNGIIEAIWTVGTNMEHGTVSLISNNSSSEKEAVAKWIRLIEDNVKAKSHHMVLIEKQNHRQQLFGIGDVLAMVTSLSNPDCPVRLLLVNRFNIPGGDSAQKIFCIRSEIPYGEETTLTDVLQEIDIESNYVRDVMKVKVTSMNIQDDLRGDIVPSLGKLDDGSRYFVYRFVLFWDSFRSGPSNETSMEGVYLLPLNLPASLRTSRSALRILTLIPKHVPSKIIFEELISDITRGMKDGYTAYDAEGVPVTIFLDLVGCIGDTPALNEVLDVYGHTGNTCCHLCRYRIPERNKIEINREKIILPRYMSIHCHGNTAYGMRTNQRQMLLRNVNLSREDKIRLGMKEITDMPFLAYPRIFKSVSENVRRTENGQPVISHCLDSYKCLLIGADHLIFGMAKDTINAVLQLLPSKAHLEMYENLALEYLKQCRLPGQARIVNISQRTLLPMNISQIFALLFVSEFSFARTLLHIDGIGTEQSTTAYPRIWDGIQMVASLMRVASRLWFVPKLEEDGLSVVREYNSNHGVNFLRETQSMIEQHIQLMNAKTTYSNEEVKDYIRLGGRRDAISKALRKRKEKSILDVNKLRSYVDKPNIHRLLELAHTFLPMVGNISRLSELQFEKGHQIMKRAIENSNQKEAHLQAITSAIMNDWQGRLAMLFEKDFDVSEDNLRSLFCLLFGKESVERRKGTLSLSDKQTVISSVGPGRLVAETLRMTGMKVMSDKATSNSENYWKTVTKIDFTICRCPFEYKQLEEAELDVLRRITENAMGLLNKIYGAGKWSSAEKVVQKNCQGHVRRTARDIAAGDVVTSIGKPYYFSSTFAILHDFDNGHCCEQILRSSWRCDLTYWYIVMIFDLEGKACAVGLPCIPYTGNETCNNGMMKNRNAYQITNDEKHVRIILLNQSCQRVFVEHMCDSNCLVEDMLASNVTKHRKHILFTTFSVRGRREGFPPRSS